MKSMMKAWFTIGGGSHARVYRGLAVLKHLRSMFSEPAKKGLPHPTHLFLTLTCMPLLVPRVSDRLASLIENFLKIRPHPGADAGGSSLHQLRYPGHRKGAGAMQILLRVDGSCYRRYSPVVLSKQVRRCVLPMSRDSKQYKSAVHAQLAIAQPWYIFLLPIATCARSNGAIFASGEGSKSTPPLSGCADC